MDCCDVCETKRLMSWILPEWSAPPRVKAVSTLRAGGVSRGPFAALNLADHVGDAWGDVQRNRAILAEQCGLPIEPSWLRQVHGRAVTRAGEGASRVTADAAIADRPGRVCVVLTADCLPVLLCDRAGECVAAVHAGWRGLAAGIIEATVAQLGRTPSELIAWLGPAIGPDAFEVGPEVRARFLATDPGAVVAFRAGRADRWLADIYQLAQRCLRALGIERIYGGELCTYSDPRRFFSYRRDGTCGRMATLIWLADEGPVA